MSVTTKLIGFLVGLTAVFGGALGVGTLVGPVGAPAEAGHEGMAMDGMDMDGMDMGAGADGQDSTAQNSTAQNSTARATDLPKGLMVAQDGYTFRLAKATAAPGAAVPVSFTIEGADGSPVTEYDVQHEQDLHLIAVRRDFTGFQHVHPEMDSEGTWTTPLNLTSGEWRLFADFKAAGADPLTLGNDLAVAGTYQPAAPAADSRTATVDGYAVTLDGDLVAGEEAKLTLTVTREGKPVTDLEPYLGAYGHLVALRSGDLAYLHVHPEGTPGDGETEPGPDVVFYTKAPSAGRYHLYLDFKHQGVVRTAAFTVTGTGSAPSSSPEAGESEDGHSGDEH